MKLKKLFLIISLCASVALHAEITNTIMHENANDGDTHGWVIYDAYPSGAKIENINDAQRGKVIKFTGRELKNGVDFLRWNDDNNLIQWKMKSNVWGAFYVVIQTSKGFRYLTYSPRDYDKGIGTSQKYKIRFGLGTKMRDGEWHTFTRDVKADLKKFEPDNEYLYIQGIKFRGTASFDDIKTMRETAIPSTNLKPIYIIGDSTVHASGVNYHHYGVHMSLFGWGERLNQYAKNSNMIINRARSGSESESYKTNYTDQSNKWYLGLVNRFWDNTKQLIQNNPNKGFLLIQFGGNDAIPSHNISPELFKNNLKTYIDEAKNTLHTTPVLVSGIAPRKWYTNRNKTVNLQALRKYAKYVNEVAQEEDVLLLDLYKKSVDTWEQYYLQHKAEYDATAIGNQFNDIKVTKQLIEADRRFSYVNYFSGVNNTHLSENGAKIVAGWVKDLACESNRADGQELCSQFK